MTRFPLSFLHFLPTAAPTSVQRWMTVLALAACPLAAQAHGHGQHNNTHAQHAATNPGPAVPT